MAKAEEDITTQGTNAEGLNSKGNKGKGRATPKSNRGIDYDAIAEKNRKARMQWLAIFGTLALIAIVAIVLLSVFTDGVSY